MIVSTYYHDNYSALQLEVGDSYYQLFTHYNINYKFWYCNPHNFIHVVTAMYCTVHTEMQEA